MSSRPSRKRASATRKPLPSVVDGTKTLSRLYRACQSAWRACRSKRKRQDRHSGGRVSSRTGCAEAERTVSFENAPKGSIDFPILSMSVRGRPEGFSRIDGRLESFRVARNARLRDRDAGIPPLGRGWGECRCREPKPQALSRATAAGAPIALARCPRLWFVVKKQMGCLSYRYRLSVLTQLCNNIK